MSLLHSLPVDTLLGIKSNIFLGNNGSINAAAAVKDMSREEFMAEIEKAIELLNAAAVVDIDNASRYRIYTEYLSLYLHEKRWLKYGYVSASHNYFGSQLLNSRADFDNDSTQLETILMTFWVIYNFRNCLLTAKEEAFFSSTAHISNPSRYNDMLMDIINKILEQESTNFDTDTILFNPYTIALPPDMRSPMQLTMLTVKDKKLTLIPLAPSLAKALRVMAKRCKYDINKMHNFENISREMTEIMQTCILEPNLDMYELHLAKTREEIVEVYKNSTTTSCMSKPEGFYGIREAATNELIHPAAVYETPDIDCYYIMNNKTGKMVSRTLVNKATNAYVRIYGVEHIMRAKLAAIGVKTQGSLNGARIKTIPIVANSSSQLEPRHFLGAYFDGPKRLRVTGNTITLTDKGSNHSNPLHSRPIIDAISECKIHGRINNETELDTYMSMKAEILSFGIEKLKKPLPDAIHEFAVNNKLPDTMDCPICVLESAFDKQDFTLSGLRGYQITIKTTSDKHKRDFDKTIMREARIVANINENTKANLGALLQQRVCKTRDDRLSMSLVNKDTDAKIKLKPEYTGIKSQKVDDTTTTLYPLRISTVLDAAETTKIRISFVDIPEIISPIAQIVNMSPQICAQLFRDIMPIDTNKALFLNTTVLPLISRNEHGIIDISYIDIRNGGLVRDIHNIDSINWEKARKRINETLEYSSLPNSRCAIARFTDAEIHLETRDIKGMVTPVFIANDKGVNCMVRDESISDEDIEKLFGVMTAKRFRARTSKRDISQKYDVYYAPSAVVETVVNSDMTTKELPTVYGKLLDTHASRGCMHVIKSAVTPVLNSMFEDDTTP